MSNANDVLSGSCLCGAIKYRVLGGIETANMAHCHCIDCQKFHGAAFSTFACPRKNLEWVLGKDNLSTYVSDNGAERQFYRICGSSLTFRGLDGTLEFSLSTLDDGARISPQPVPDAHVFCRSRVSWVDIQDSLPNYQSGRPPSK